VNINQIKDFVLSKTNPENKKYSQYDEIYSFWALGFSLGKVLLSCCKSEDNIPHSIAMFKDNYKSLETLSPLFGTEKKIIDQLLQKIILAPVNDKSDIENNIQQIDSIKSAFIEEIQIYSTHLSNTFDFGYQLNRLHFCLLSKDISISEEAIQATIQVVLKLLNGDKRLSSPNIELSQVNLNITKRILKYLKKKLEEINSLKKEQASLFIGNRITMIQEIVLDIYNPIHYINNRVIFIVFIYYSIISIYVLLAFLIEECGLMNELKDDNIFLYISIPTCIILLWSLKYLWNCILIKKIIMKINKELKKG